MEAGVVEVVRLGDDYRFVHNESKNQFEFHYAAPDGKRTCAAFTYCVDARGQPRSLETDGSDLTRSLIRRGLVRIDPGDAEKGGSVSGGSIRIDPLTHRVVRTHSASDITSDFDIYAVGAMTRGQIIDASMALGLARSTETVATLLIKKLSGLRKLD
jgi:hypothetical protein